MTQESMTLLTDFYQLTMAYGYFKSKMSHKRACFHLFFRRPPFKGGFTIACGLEAAAEFIENFRFSASDLEYLASLKNSLGHPYFEQDFLEALDRLKLQVDLYAVPEGRLVFPQEPLIRVEGPLLHCQLLESPLLNIINFPTLIATKAARVCLAAQGDPVSEFGMRRAQGINGALTASRAAFVGGCSSTSHVLAGKKFGIPVQGTHAHSWVMAFDDEEESFKAYAQALGESCIFLVDTYDSLEGVKKACRVGKWLRAHGKEMLGIRLDSGDLAALSIEARKILDEEGFSNAKIVASNELDETVISELKHQGAKISLWGVGTNLVTAKDQAALDGVYKLSAIQDDQGVWHYTLKLSEQPAKVTNPGRLQVRRFMYNDCYVADILYDETLGIEKPQVNVDPFDPTKSVAISKNCTSCDLLQPVFQNGTCVYTFPTLQEVQQTTKTELDRLAVGMKRFLNPHIYPVGMEKHLYDLKVKLIKKIRKKLKVEE